jgi:hypothetical protein
MIPVPHPDHVVVPGERPRHQHGQVVGLAPAVDEIGDVEAGRHLAGQPLRHEREVRMQVDGRGVLDGVELRLDPLDELRVRVAAGHRHDPREHVQIAPSRLVVEVLHEAFHDHQGLAIVQERAGMAVLPPQREHLLLRGTAVRARSVIARRHDRASGRGQGHGMLLG